MSRLLHKGGSSFCIGLMILTTFLYLLEERVGMSLYLFAPLNLIVGIPTNKPL